MKIDKTSLIRKFNQGTLTKEELEFLESLITDNQIDIEELESYALFKETFKSEQFDLEKIDSSFYQMMNEQIDIHKAREKKSNWFNYLPTPIKYAVPAFILVIGVFIGRMWDIKTMNPSYNNQLYVSKERTTSIDQFLHSPLVSARVEAMSRFEEDNGEINLLFFSLNNDESNIVRVEAIDFILKYSDNVEIRTRLINSIKEQKSPYVVQYLSEVLQGIGEKVSLEKFRSLYNQEIPGEIIEKMEINLHTS